jgi:hypothetical protein
MTRFDEGHENFNPTQNPPEVVMLVRAGFLSFQIKNGPEPSTLLCHDIRQLGGVVMVDPFGGMVGVHFDPMQTPMVVSAVYNTVHYWLYQTVNEQRVVG